MQPCAAERRGWSAMPFATWNALLQAGGSGFIRPQVITRWKRRWWWMQQGALPSLPAVPAPRGDRWTAWLVLRVIFLLMRRYPRLNPSYWWRRSKTDGGIPLHCPEEN